MNTKGKYLFTSERLGFRNWEQKDIEAMSLLNTDENVMKFFPKTLTQQQTIEFIKRMQNQFSKNGFCYFAVDVLETQSFIGFIGLCEQTYEADFTPCIDIGWRLKSSEWGKGYATEGAKRCLEFAQKNLGLKEILSIAPKVNNNSERVMQKIGMQKVKEFLHPMLLDYDHLKACVLYKINLPVN